MTSTFFGGTTPVDWRDVIVVDEGDDEDGDESDSSVVAMLGFDPDDADEFVSGEPVPFDPRLDECQRHRKVDCPECY